jgi:hypothetical protein
VNLPAPVAAARTPRRTTGEVGEDEDLIGKADRRIDPQMGKCWKQEGSQHGSLHARGANSALSAFFPSFSSPP